MSNGRKIGDYYVDIDADTTGLNKSLDGITKKLAAVFAFDVLKDFAVNVAQVSAEFERYEAVLSNALGSQLQAEAALSKITRLAAQTPFAVNELSSAFVKLTNQGFIPAEKEMIKLGDIAASTGKSFDQLAEAIIDAQVGEFERLKEFGIRASKQGDQVAFTFKGVETQVEFTSEAIQSYILGLGEVEGVTGAMAKISETTGGKISNLGDNLTNLTKAIGDGNSGLIAGVLDLSLAMTEQLTTAISSVNTVAEKTGTGGFESFFMQLRALTDPVYAASLEAQAKGFNAIDEAAAEAEAAIVQKEKAEQKAVQEKEKAIQEAIMARKEKSDAFYQETLQFSQDYVTALQIEADALMSIANMSDRVQKSAEAALAAEGGPKIVDFGINLDGPPKAEKAEEIANQVSDSLTLITDNANLAANAFSGLGNAIVQNMDGASGALKAFLSTFVNAVGQYIAQSLKMAAVDKAKATGKMVNIAANTAAAAGPLSAIVFPSILSGLLALISGVFGGGVRSGGGGGGGAPRSVANTFTGTQATASLIDNIDLTGELIVTNGGNLSVLIKNQDLKKRKT